MSVRFTLFSDWWKWESVLKEIRVVVTTNTFDRTDPTTLNLSIIESSLELGQTLLTVKVSVATVVDIRSVMSGWSISAPDLFT